MAKCHVSEIPLDKLHAALPAFERHLLPHGFGIYSIDYTQDFSGVLDHKALVHFLQEFEGFREKGEFAAALEEGRPTILENTASVGKHVCTWIAKTRNNRTVRTKMYNKIVSSLQAGEVREPKP